MRNITKWLLSLVITIWLTMSITVSINAIMVLVDSWHNYYAFIGIGFIFLWILVRSVFKNDPTD